VYFAPKLVTAPGIPLHLDVSSMIAPREDSIGVVASISSHSTAESSSSTRELIVQAAKFGPTARLKLRDPNNALTHHVMDLSMTELPVGPYPGAAPNVLGIGDSILNRQGAQFLSEALTAAGYSANFIGTMPGSASVANPNDMSGPMGEGREAYSTGNYTYADISEITIPLAPGDEAAYLAMSKVERRNRNPFIRAATGADDPAIVRNGYVLDFAFYQARFSLPTPDVIVYALGMNEFIRVTNGNDLYAYMLDNEKLMMQRIRAAWPDVKILRCLPGLPFQKTRNPQWTDRYIPMIRGVMANLNVLADSKNTLVPSWTFANPETGYTTANDIVDPITGIHQVEISDNTHPVGANRRRLYQGIAPYIAAAKLNLI
jgi:lysophospholipase L1-like esterase